MIVRGYLAGSGWKDYGRTGSVCGIPLPAGLRESDRLPEPLFTPSTKAEEGHDENISIDEAAALVGRDVAERVAELAIALYRRGSEIAEPAGIILADTKFEFGIDPATGELILIDEVLTPDSRASGTPRTTSRAGPRRASTSSTSATISRRWTGTRRRPGRSFPTRSSPGRGRGTSRRSSGSPGPASSAISTTT